MMNHLFASSVLTLRNQSTALNVISENLANVNTNGYKRSSVQFADITRDSESVLSAGNGFSGNMVDIRNFYSDDGIVSATNRELDGAISGRGFFITHPEFGGTEEFELTSNGNFRGITREGTDEVYLADGPGNFVMGWPYDPATETFQTGTTTASLQPIRIDRDAPLFEARATDELNFSANFDADLPVGSEVTIDTTVLDGSGNDDNDSRRLVFNFQKVDNETWSVAIAGDDATIAQQPANLVFNENGELVGGREAQLDITWTDPDAATSIALDFFGSLNVNGTTGALDIEANGVEAGRLNTIRLAEDGIVLGRFSNGEEAPIAKLAAGAVRQPNKMDQVDGPRFLVTEESGELEVIDMAERASVNFTAGALELSNTDIATEFADLIQTQRVYNTASQVVNAVDEMLQTATNIR